MQRIKHLEDQLEVELNVHRPDALLAKYVSNSFVKQLSLNAAAQEKISAATESNQIFSKIDKMEAAIQ